MRIVSKGVSIGYSNRHLQKIDAYANSKYMILFADLINNGNLDNELSVLYYYIGRTEFNEGERIEYLKNKQK